MNRLLLILLLLGLNVVDLRAANTPLFEPNLQPTVYSNEVRDAVYLSLDPVALGRLYAANEGYLELSLPATAHQEALTLVLEQVEVTTANFVVQTSDGKKQAYSNGHHYRGSVKHTHQTIASISLFDDSVMGLVSLADGSNIILGEINDPKLNSRTDYILYNDRNLLLQHTFDCGSEQIPQPFYDASHIIPPTHHADNSRELTDTITFYFECDYKLFTDKGSTANVANYVTGLFNQVTSLYANENIRVAIEQIYVWTSADPYPNTSSSAALDAFRDAKNGAFSADIAHLLSTTNNNNGGIAYLDVLCQGSKYYAVGYSNIYNSYAAVPTYSWSVECLTHELGHNLGSPHTQACAWNGSGQALDNCYPTEGSCSPGPAPTNGGTIMSYCHLTSYGINFNNGFGTQPGNLIRSRVTNATCLSGVPPTPVSCTDTYETNNKRSQAKTIPKNTTIAAKIATSTDRDWFKFNTTSTKDITITLSNVPADYDMVIYRGTTQVGISENPYPYNESVFLDNAVAGTYYIYVYGWGGAYSDYCYNLSANIASPTIPAMPAGSEGAKNTRNATKLYPNPANDAATLSLFAEQHTTVQLQITDLSGRIITQHSAPLHEGSNTLSIDTQALPNGMYWLQTNQQGNRYTYQLLVQH